MAEMTECKDPIVPVVLSDDGLYHEPIPDGRVVEGKYVQISSATGNQLTNKINDLDPCENGLYVPESSSEIEVVPGQVPASTVQASIPTTMRGGRNVSLGEPVDWVKFGITDSLVIPRYREGEGGEIDPPGPIIPTILLPGAILGVRTSLNGTGEMPYYTTYPVGYVTARFNFTTPFKTEQELSDEYGGTVQVAYRAVITPAFDRENVINRGTLLGFAPVNDIIVVAANHEYVEFHSSTCADPATASGLVPGFDGANMQFEYTVFQILTHAHKLDDAGNVIEEIDNGSYYDAAGSVPFEP